MRFTTALRDVSSVCAPTAFQFASEKIPAAWIDEALRATETASIRKRKLPAEHVVWLVLGMALFRDRSIHAVVEQLGLAKATEDEGPRGSVVAASVAEARGRLGAEPMRLLFKRTAKAWHEQRRDDERWRGLEVFAVDGTTQNVPDTKANHDYFGRPGVSRGGVSAYPKARLVALTAPRSHLVVGMSIGAFKEGEQTLAAELWPLVPDQSVTILDRGFLVLRTLFALQSAERERHWLTRATKQTKWTQQKKLGRGDLLVQLRFSKQALKKDPSLPEGFVVRAIQYQRPGFQPQWLLTSLLHHKKYPAQEIAELYHERWEIEIAFDEKKTHMMQREEALRSKTPQGVLQELWGLALAYNIVRLMMASVAKEASVSPRRISFWNALLLIRNFLVMAWHDAPGTLPKLLANMRGHLRLLILPERRSRSSPRQVKIKMSSYPKKPALPHARLKTASQE